MRRLFLVMSVVALVGSAATESHKRDRFDQDVPTSPRLIALETIRDFTFVSDAQVSARISERIPFVENAAAVAAAARREIESYSTMPDWFHEFVDLRMRHWPEDDGDMLGAALGLFEVRGHRSVDPVTLAHMLDLWAEFCIKPVLEGAQMSPCLSRYTTFNGRIAMFYSLSLAGVRAHIDWLIKAEQSQLALPVSLVAP